EEGQISVVSKRLHQPLRVAHVILGGVGLLHEDVALLAKPSTRPCFVCPAQAEGKPWSAGAQHIEEGALDQSSAVEPVVVIAESLQAVSLRKLRLGLSAFR